MENNSELVSLTDTTSDSVGRNLYRVRQVAQMLAFCERTVKRMIDRGEIRALRVRGRWMVTTKDYHAYVESRISNQR